MEKMKRMKQVLRSPSKERLRHENGSIGNVNTLSSNSTEEGSMADASPRSFRASVISFTSKHSNNNTENVRSSYVEGEGSFTLPKSLSSLGKDVASSLKGTLRKRKEKSLSLIGTVRIVFSILFLM